VTDQFGTQAFTKFKASYLCTPAFEGSAHFVAHIDGTVTDHYTGLQWEKKVDRVCVGGTNDGNVCTTDSECPGGSCPTGPHDADNTYTWCVGSFPNCTNPSGPPDGTVFTDFLGKLNNCTSSDGTAVTNAGFAGHCDWRLPTIQELKTIVDLTQGNCGGGSGACIDPVFGPTAADGYWSATTDAGNPDFVWSVQFFLGGVGAGGKSGNNAVRAVRAGS
jgi:hypothetical protein